MSDSAEARAALLTAAAEALFERDGASEEWPEWGNLKPRQQQCWIRAAKPAVDAVLAALPAQTPPLGYVESEEMMAASAMAEIVHLPSPDGAIRHLHAELERLASTAAASYITRTPLRIETGSSGEQLMVWHDDGALRVLTAEGGVFLSGTTSFEYGRDWFAVTNTQVRALAHALLSAVAHVHEEH
ncbi:hypothetical protein ABIC28_005152 [Rhodococcus sp. PvR044]|uniref:hypothetical protein n=1 Tax=Rhodococcus sp. PvR044 TaxID=3156402 RepID=UPI0033982A80